MRIEIKRLLYIILYMILFVAFDLACPIRLMFSFPCPTCGMTSAWMSVLKLDLANAFASHPLFWLGPVVVFLMCSENMNKKLRDILCIVVGVSFFIAYLVKIF